MLERPRILLLAHNYRHTKVVQVHASTAACSKTLQPKGVITICVSCPGVGEVLCRTTIPDGMGLNPHCGPASTANYCEWLLHYMLV
eukprot:jgi/Chrzof1/14050/Cz08g22180.t1